MVFQNIALPQPFSRINDIIVWATIRDKVSAKQAKHQINLWKFHKASQRLHFNKKPLDMKHISPLSPRAHLLAPTSLR